MKFFQTASDDIAKDCQLNFKILPVLYQLYTKTIEFLQNVSAHPICMYEFAHKIFLMKASSLRIWLLVCYDPVLTKLASSSNKVMRSKLTEKSLVKLVFRIRWLIKLDDSTITC